MLKLRKVISGGQTGADKTGLLCAQALGLETGGTAPRGWKIDGGTDPSLKDFGLTESLSTDYAVRTRNNVLDADVTLWFGNTTSPGYWCTINACKNLKKPYYVNPSEAELEYVCNSYEIANVAGNRARMNKNVVGLVKQAFEVIAKVLGKTKFCPHIGEDCDCGGLNKAFGECPQAISDRINGQ